MNFKHPIDAHYRQTICRIGQHEAGHYMVTRVLGFKAGSINITVTDLLGGHSAGSEITLPKKLTNIENTIEYLEHRICILYAGVLAESLTKGEVDNNLALASLKTGGGKSDSDRATELLHLLRNLKHPNSTTEDEQLAELESINNKLWNKSADIIIDGRAFIEGLGRRLSSEIKYVGDTFSISEEELNSLPAIIEYFSSEKAT